MPDDRKPPSFWDRVKQAPLWVKIVVPVILLIAIATIFPAEEENGGDGEATTEAVATEPEPEPAPKPAPAAPEVSDEEVEEALSDLSAEEVVDLGFFDEEKFCRAYAEVLSAGLGEDTAYGNFLRGYQQGGFEGGPSAREVFDELVSRC